MYFGGHTDMTTIGLGGSVEHMFGGPGNALAHSHSVTPNLLSVLYPELELDRQAPMFRRPGEDAELLAVELATEQSEGTTQMLEFVAKRLMWGESRPGEEW